MQTIRTNLKDYIHHCDDVYRNSCKGLLNPKYYKRTVEFFKEISKAFRKNESDKIFKMGPRHLN